MNPSSQPHAGLQCAAVAVPPMQRAPQRISITLSWQLHQRLLQRSDWEGRSLSNLAAHLLENAC
jgi:type II secretory pathway component PulK